MEPNFDFLTSPSHAVRKEVHRVNKEYLLLAKEICTIDPAASVTLGIPAESVALIAGLSAPQIHELARRELLLAVPRIKDPAKWRDVLRGGFDDNKLMTMILAGG